MKKPEEEPPTPPPVVEAPLTAQDRKHGLQVILWKIGSGTLPFAPDTQNDVELAKNFEHLWMRGARGQAAWGRIVLYCRYRESLIFEEPL